MLSIEADDEAKTVSSETEWAFNQSETESVGKGFVCTLYTEQKNEASNEAFNTRLMISRIRLLLQH